MQPLRYCYAAPGDLNILAVDFLDMGTVVVPLLVRGEVYNLVSTIVSQGPVNNFPTQGFWQDHVLVNADACARFIIQEDLPSHFVEFDYSAGEVTYIVRVCLTKAEPSIPTPDLDLDNVPDVITLSDNADDTANTTNTEVSDIQREPDPAPTPAPNAFRGAPVSDNSVRTSQLNPSNVSRLRR